MSQQQDSNKHQRVGSASQSEPSAGARPKQQQVQEQKQEAACKVVAMRQQPQNQSNEEDIGAEQESCGQPIKSTQSKLAATLHSAANEGKVELVRLLLRCGADVNAQDDQFGNTALHQAAWNGFSETVQMLCKYRANTSIKNKAQFTPLHMACQQGHNQSTRILLVANAKTEAKNSYGDTPLHTAARYGHAGAARILLSAKSNPNQVNKNHDTPLHIAAAMGRRKLTKIFMQNGAEPAIKNKQNETAMDIALRKDLIDIQELIANPPAPAAARKQHQKPSEFGAAGQLSKLEQQYGSGQQLYGGAASGELRHQRRVQRHCALLATEEAPLTWLGSANQLRRQQARLHKRFRSTCEGHELAVDVEPTATTTTATTAAAGEQLRRQLGSGNKPEQALVNNRFSSLHSLSLASSVQLSARPDSSRKPLTGATDRRARNKTLCGGSGGQASELSLLTKLLANQHISSPPPATGALHTSSAVLAPDERDNVRPAPQQTRTTKSDQQQQKLEAWDRKSASPRTSPVASVRSSLSKSRGRLLIKRAQRRQKPGLLVRRPNLGTCVGKLSLLRLRNMVQVREQQQQQLRVQAEQGSTSGTALNQASTPASGANICGRRQERLERGVAASPQTADLHRAPNGTALRTTRPLADLNDDTQLYAIPKKSNSKPQAGAKQQVVAGSRPTNSGSGADGRKAEDEQQEQAGEAAASSGCQQPERVPSGGPALTSDHSSSAGSSASSSLNRASTTTNQGDSSSSRSSRIASSSDECVELVCAANNADSNKSGAGKVVAVRAEPATGDSFSALPGYSIGREPSSATTTQPCPCQQKEPQQSQPKTTTAPTKSSAENSKQQQAQQMQQQVASNNNDANNGGGNKCSNKPNRLRQLLGLQTLAQPEAAAQRTPMSAIAGGYYAYSAVAPANSEMRKQKQQSKSNVKQEASQQAKATKRSWLMSKFSLSSGNLVSQVEADEQPAVANRSPNVQCQQLQTEAGQSEGSIVGAPERKAELIGLGAEQRGGEETVGPHLIRPKSALSATSSDLIAAQKSLAAAAAAKVNRDRQIKLDSGRTEMGSQLSAANKGGALTVKTSPAEPFWSQANGGHQSQFMLQLVGQTSHRSGTNSAGMSDTSPSNNGAESDNSIQTNGSLTNASQQTTNSMDQNPSPLGILSRILLNNKSLGRKSSAEHHQRGNHETQQATNSKQADGSLCSTSSTLSSPAVSNSRQQLDQLGSRSRCPIVVSRSNELPVAEEETSSCQQEPLVAAANPKSQPAPAPRLPSKSALKQPGISRANHAEDRSQPGRPLIGVESAVMNGLPRVASFGQLCQTSGQMMMSQQQQLCQYHALNRQHLIQTHYSPYLPYALGRYTSPLHEPCEPLSAPKYLRQHDQEMQDEQQQLGSLRLPAQAVNYEYYLDGPSYQQQQLNHANGYSNHQRFCANNDNSSQQYPPIGFAQNTATHEDSIYIPYVNASLIRDQANRNSIQNNTKDLIGGKASSFATHYLSSQHHHAHEDAYNNNRNGNHHNHHQQLQRRPKSSLDTYLIHSSSVNQSGVQQQRQVMQQNSNGQWPSATPSNAIGNGGQFIASATNQEGLTASADSYPSQAGKQQALTTTRGFYPQEDPFNLSVSSSSSSSNTNFTENSIYASERSTSNLRSELTVLPANAELEAGDGSDQAIAPTGKALTGGGSAASSANCGSFGGATSIHVNSPSRLTPRAAQQDMNSWTPAPYKSLVQVNQSSPGAGSIKSNQSSSLQQQHQQGSSSPKTINVNKPASQPTTLKINNVNNVCRTNSTSLHKTGDSTRQSLRQESIEEISCSPSPIELVPDDCNGSTVL